ncbi:hypothetical protein ANN_05092 [Periplaneta americana]|uniref:Uncharacterized protein n=1 Tax=Periplaneta americana TaxID=6978 RepID=A0ABQ8TAA3_PERAM|nr:hypothetical protein ANN_05092 [Periplaneta americana]
MWLQHDGAPAHFDTNVRHYLDATYPNRWIGRGKACSMDTTFYNLVIFYNDEDSPKDYPAFAFWLGKTSEKPNQVISVPSLLYGSETWVMKKKDASRLQTNEMKFLRSVAGYRKIEHKRIETREELEVYELNNKIEEYMNTWISHISRMQEDRIPYTKIQVEQEHSTRKHRSSLTVTFPLVLIRRNTQHTLSQQNGSTPDPESVCHTSWHRDEISKVNALTGQTGDYPVDTTDTHRSERQRGSRECIREREREREREKSRNELERERKEPGNESRREGEEAGIGSEREKEAGNGSGRETEETEDESGRETEEAGNGQKEKERRQRLNQGEKEEAGNESGRETEGTEDE